MSVLDWILLALAVVVSIPLLVLTIEAVLSLLPLRAAKPVSERPPCDILVPAHNEESGMATTVANIRSQMRTGDRLVVIADNCTDRTAEIARECGAEVLERNDVANRGKGYALAYGLSQLDPNSPEIVTLIDADCELGPGALDTLIIQATSTQQPAQGIYLIGTGREPDARRQISAFAVLLKNQIRPLGLYHLSLPCLLMGAGMAFPKKVLAKANLQSGNIVEDMKLGIDLACLGHSPQLCPAARISSAAAPDRSSTIKQRTRWEHGHVQTIIAQAPRLFGAGIVQGRPSLIGLALELAVPPLSLLVVSAVGVALLCLLSGLVLGGSWAPALVVWVALIAAGGAIFGAWIRHGRGVLPAKTLAKTPLYIGWKLPIYLKLLTGREKTWVRTERLEEK